MVKEIAEHNRRFGADLTRYYRIQKIRMRNILKRIVLDHYSR